MAKGLFTQGMCVLLRDPISIDEVRDRLASFELMARQESPDEVDSPETLVYSFRPEVAGTLLVTPCACPWPDDMGINDESPDRLLAWSLGQFGPLVFPGGLDRALNQAPLCDVIDDDESESEPLPKPQEMVDLEAAHEALIEEAKQHTAHIRLLISYVIAGEDDEEAAGSEDDDVDMSAMVPDDYDALAELNFLTRAVTTLLEAPSAICYFNPNGEVILGADQMRRGLNHAWNHNVPPLDMWTTVRLYELESNWVMMDTVGNGQFDLPDMEAVFDADAFEFGDVEQFIRSATLFQISQDEEIVTGDTADGPGGKSWKALECEDSLSDPPRLTVRWFPDDDSEPPAATLETGSLYDGDDGEESDGDEESFPF